MEPEANVKIQFFIFFSSLRFLEISHLFDATADKFLRSIQVTSFYKLTTKHFCFK